MKIEYNSKTNSYIAFRSEDDVCLASSYEDALAFMNDDQLELIPI